MRLLTLPTAYGPALPGTIAHVAWEPWFRCPGTRVLLPDLPVTDVASRGCLNYWRRLPGCTSARCHCVPLRVAYVWRALLPGVALVPLAVPRCHPGCLRPSSVAWIRPQLRRCLDLASCCHDVAGCPRCCQEVQAVVASAELVDVARAGRSVACLISAALPLRRLMLPGSTCASRCQWSGACCLAA